jgi:hypothetical protein
MAKATAAPVKYKSVVFIMCDDVGLEVARSAAPIRLNANLSAAEVKSTFIKMFGAANEVAHEGSAFMPFDEYEWPAGKDLAVKYLIKKGA